MIFDRFVDSLNNVCGLYPTKTYGDGCVNFGRAKWLQKADYIPIISTIAAVARVIIATVGFICNCIRGDAKIGAELYAKYLLRAAAVIIPGLGNVIAVLWDDAKGKDLDFLEKDKSNIFRPIWVK